MHLDMQLKDNHVGLVVIIDAVAVAVGCKKNTNHRMCTLLKVIQILYRYQKSDA
jgi:hypothetical protein